MISRSATALAASQRAELLGYALCAHLATAMPLGPSAKRLRGSRMPLLSTMLQAPPFPEQYARAREAVS